MSTEINVSVPYAGGQVASGSRNNWQAFDWCLVGGNDGRLGVTIRFQTNPHFFVVDVWELNADEKSATDRTIVSKQLVPSDGSAMYYNKLISTCKLNDTTFLVKQANTTWSTFRVFSVDPATYEVTLEYSMRDNRSGNSEWGNPQNAMMSYQHWHPFFMYPIDENKVVTYDEYKHGNPYYRLNERVWDPVNKVLNTNLICHERTTKTGDFSAQSFLDNYFSTVSPYPAPTGNSVGYLHQYDYVLHSLTGGIPTAHGNDNSTSAFAYKSQWVTMKKDRVGRLHFIMTNASSNQNGIQNIGSSAGQYWTVVYIPDSIRSEGENPWTICSGNGNFMNGIRGNVSTYSEENKLGTAWLPLNIKKYSDLDSSSGIHESQLYSMKNLLVGKNSFKVMEDVSNSIPYDNNSFDNNNEGSSQRIIQSEWLDEDHFIVFYSNKVQYSDRNANNGGASVGGSYDGNIRYKIVRLIDEYMAKVVSTGAVNSNWWEGRLNRMMTPFELSDNNTTITSDSFKDLYALYVPNFNPTVTNDTYTMVEDSVLTVSDVNLSVLVNDNDLDGDTLTVSTDLVVSPYFGSASMNADGTFTYTPNANFTGTDSFAYRALDGVGGFADGIVYITVTPTADDPTAVSDVYTIAEDQSLTLSDINLGVLANDVDVDGDSLTIDTTPVNVPSNGSLTLNSNGTFDYTPNANFNGTDSFEYKVEDGTGRAASAIVTINVTAVNDSPVAVVDSFTMNEDETLTTSVSLLANDSDLDGDSLTVNTTPVVDVVNGTLTLNADGTFTYVPPANHHGAELFTYEVSDGNGGTAQASVTITIYAVNDTPVPVSDNYSVDENSSLDVELSVGLIANDADLDGDTLTVDTTPVVDVSNGTLVLSSDGTFTYTPYANYYGSDSFTYRVTDGNGGAATTSVNITISEVPNQAPVISGVDANYTLTQGQYTNVIPTASDIDGDSFTWSYEEVASGSSYAVIGVSYDDDNGSNSGSVYVYDANDLSATPTKLTAFDGAENDRFGTSSAIDGDTLVVGSWLDDDGGDNSGSVYVYDLNDLSAAPTKLTAFDGAANDYFGNRVAINHNKIVVGAYFEDELGTDAGAVYVYDRNNLSAQPTKLTAFDGAPSDYFGQTLTITSNKLIVGVQYDDDGGMSAGSVYVYDLNDLSATPTKLSDSAVADYFGSSVSATDDILIVGAYGDLTDGNSGSAYVYDLNNLSASPTKLIGQGAHGMFGWSTGVSGDKIVVGAYGDTDNGSNSGAVYVYDANDLSAAPTKLTAFDGADNDLFGYQVAIDGDMIMVGARDADNGASNTGAVYVYDANDLSAAPTKLTAFDGAENDRFGGDIIAISSAGSSLNGVTVTQSGNTFSFYPGSQDASFDIAFKATDTFGNVGVATSSFDFTYVNQAPTLSGISASYTLTQGVNEVIVPVVSDAEGEPFTLSYEEVLGEGVPSGLNGTTVSQNGNDFTITPGSADANFTLRFTATDASGNSSSITSEFSLDYNAAPTISGVNSSYTLTQGQDTQITVTTSDADGDTVSLSYAIASGNLAGTTVTQADNVFTVTPGSQDATFQLMFTATDTNGASTDVTSDFTLDYNAPPVVMGIEAAYTLTTGQDEVIVGIATDADGDSTTWSYEEVLANGVPSGLNGTTIAQNGDVFTITPGSADANFTLRFTATDSAGNETSTDADFSHTYVAPVTTAPVAAGTWTVVTAAQFGNNYNGQAFIMRESGSNTTLSTPATGNMVGSSVAIGDDYVFVGNSHYDAYGDNAGAVFVFNKDTGSMVGTLQASTMSANTGFGSEDMSVAAGGNRIAVRMSKRAQIVGSPSESFGYGHIEIMNHDGTNRVEISHPDFDINQGYANMMGFGLSTGWTSTKFVAGMNSSDANGTDSGSVIIYNLDGTVSTRLDGSAASEKFGFDIATQPNHDKILVGIPGWNNDAGRVKLFDESGTEIMTIERPNSEAGAHGRADCQFGRNVAYGSGRIAVSELLDTSVGRVHIFDEADGSYINTVSGPRSDNFGTGDIQIAGNYIFVSASGYNSNNGAFWVYDLDGNNGSRINNIGTSGFAQFGNKLAASVEE